MKKVLSFLLAVCFIVVTAQSAWAAATPLATATIAAAGQSGSIIKYVYDSTTSVTVGVTTVFKIATPTTRGRIIGIQFVSTSPDCDLWLSEADSQAATSKQTILHVESINLGGAPEISQPPFYVNRDTTEAAFLYLSVYNPNAIATGNWSAVITYGK